MKTKLQQTAKTIIKQAKVKVINKTALFTVTPKQIYDLEMALKESLKETKQQ